VKEWLSHVITYVCVMALLTVVWGLSSGHDGDYLRELLTEDQQNLGAQFWPIWPMLGWGIAVAIHTVVFVLSIPSRAVRAVTGADRKELAEAPAPAVTGPSRRWVVVMFTDVVGSTTLNERLGDDIWHPIIAAYRDVVRLAMARHGGTEVTTAGDGFLVRFDSPLDAVLCAVDIQRALDDDRAEGGTSPNVRIGIHAGDAVHDSGDVLGHVVNLASRVSDAAEPDEILVTEPVADHVDATVKLEDRGLRELKGIGQPRHLLAVRW
jgi:class 3 adenylate cyclase